MSYFHFNFFPIESKYMSESNKYIELVKKSDVVGILNLLTNQEVEKKVLKRSFLKASTYGQDISGTQNLKVFNFSIDFKAIFFFFFFF